MRDRFSPAFARAAALGLATLVVLSGSFAGCSTNPVTGREEIVLMSEEREDEIGKQAAVEVAAQLGIVDDPKLHEYVNAIGQELASLSPRSDVEYEFEVVEMEEPNAFALPGGYVYVSRGLLALANSEAELANVIGHEIGHVAARHAAQRDTVQKAATILSILGMAAAVATSGDGRAVLASQYLGAGIVASYSREQERQADRVAIELTAKAGIDPGGMARFLKQLDNATRLQTGASRAPGFFDSHPATPERFAEATTRAQVERWSPGFSIAKSRREFLERIDGIVVGPAAKEGVFRENIFLHADMRFALRFPHGWRQLNLRDRVVAVSPGGDAITALELAGAGDDPRAAAAAYARANQLGLDDAAPIRIGDLHAFRARSTVRTGNGFVDALLTWVAYDGQIYLLTAGTPAGAFPKYEGILRSFARGFRPLREADLAQIDELRLRIVEAKEGDTLAALSEREGNAWNLNELAVANAMFVGDALEAGQLVKIARRERYVPARRDEAPAPPRAPLQGPLPPPVGDR
ncbi:MAG: M48 family metalloprotease [Myxococcota bacterium]